LNPRRAIHSCTAWATNSGPLSLRIYSGTHPRAITAWSGAAQPVLTPEARTERETHLSALGARLTEIKNEVTTLATRITNAKAFLSCAEEAAKIESEAARFAQKRKSASAELGSLALHEKAGPFIARLTERDLLAKLHGEDETATP